MPWLRHAPPCGGIDGSKRAEATLRARRGRALRMCKGEQTNENNKQNTQQIHKLHKYNKKILPRRLPSPLLCMCAIMRGSRPRLPLSRAAAALVVACAVALLLPVTAQKDGRVSLKVIQGPPRGSSNEGTQARPRAPIPSRSRSPVSGTRVSCTRRVCGMCCLPALGNYCVVCVCAGVVVCVLVVCGYPPIHETVVGGLVCGDEIKWMLHACSCVHRYFYTTGLRWVPWARPRALAETKREVLRVHG